MKLLWLFGIGEKRIFSQGYSVPGKIVKVSRCWWLKVNTKPVRTNSYDGALFPHMVEFTYEVDGKVYQGKRYVSYTRPRPAVGRGITVFYDPDQPSHYAVEIGDNFGLQE